MRARCLRGHAARATHAGCMMLLDGHRDAAEGALALSRRFTARLGPRASADTRALAEGLDADIEALRRYEAAL